MTGQPRKRITIDALDGPTILAARHLDATEGRVQIGTTVDSATRAAISRVLDYIATAHNSRAATDLPAAAAHPIVRGRCPACRGESLFLGSGGHVTCARLDCPDPCAADKQLHGEHGQLEIANRALNTAALEADERAERAEAERDGAYRERAHLVALLAAHYPSVIAPAPDIEDEPGWQILYATLHGRQCSWHIAPRDADLFEHLDHVDADDRRARWDGHTTDEKYRHIDWIARALGTAGPFRKD